MGKEGEGRVKSEEGRGKRGKLTATPGAKGRETEGLKGRLYEYL